MMSGKPSHPNAQLGCASESASPESIRKWMKQMYGMEPPKFTVKYTLADGDSVACSGDMTMKDQNGKVGTYGFCDIYRFSGDKFAELTSFVVSPDKKDIELKAED